jgi:hypothetical protein
MKDTYSLVRPLVPTALLLIASLLGAPTLYAQDCVAPPDGMVGWWPGDGNADDFHNGYNGTLHNGATFAPGKVAQAFSFDGTDDYVEIADEEAFDFDRTDAFSIDAWINTSSNGIVNIVSKMQDEAPGQGYQLIKHQATGSAFGVDFGNRLYFFLTHSPVSGNVIRIAGSTDIADGEWHHVAVTYDGSSDAAGVQIYLDGAPEEMFVTQNELTESILNDVPLQISGRDGANAVFNGLIDEVELFDRVLDESEILDIFEAGDAGKCKNDPPVADAGPDQTAIVGETVHLDGSLSYDPDGLDVTFSWNITSQPAGSAAGLSDPNAVNPTLTPDVAGVYEVELVVNDGSADSDPDEVVVTAITPQDALADLIDQIEDLDLKQGIENALVSKLDNAIQSLDRGNDEAALGQLHAFINQVNAQRGKALSEAVADALIAQAQQLIDAINAGAASKWNGAAALAAETPAQYVLEGNYPNPFNPVTTIRLALPEAGHVRLVVYDVMGREVARLLDQPMDAGPHEATWDASGLPSGVYVYRLSSGAFSETKMMTLLK